MEGHNEVSPEPSPDWATPTLSLSLLESTHFRTVPLPIIPSHLDEAWYTTKRLRGKNKKERSSQCVAQVSTTSYKMTDLYEICIFIITFIVIVITIDYYTGA